MEGSYYRLVLAILGVWRITHLLAAENGPWHLVVRLRRAAGAGFWGQLLDCFECLSLWVAAPFALVLTGSWMECALFWLASSGAAILLEKITSRIPPVQYVEDDPNR